MGFAPDEDRRLIRACWFSRSPKKQGFRDFDQCRCRLQLEFPALISGARQFLGKNVFWTGSTWSQPIADCRGSGRRLLLRLSLFGFVLLVGQGLAEGPLLLRDKLLVAFGIHEGVCLSLLEKGIPLHHAVVAAVCTEK